MKIELTPIELSVLERCGNRTFNPYTAPSEEQDAEISLIEKAGELEASDPTFIDERFEYTHDCNLLIWFWYRYQLQEGKVQQWDGVQTQI